MNFETQIKILLDEKNEHAQTIMYFFVEKVITMTDDMKAVTLVKLFRK